MGDVTQQVGTDLVDTFERFLRFLLRLERIPEQSDEHQQKHHNNYARYKNHLLGFLFGIVCCCDVGHATVAFLAFVVNHHILHLALCLFVCHTVGIFLAFDIVFERALIVVLVGVKPICKKAQTAKMLY